MSKNKKKFKVRISSKDLHVRNDMHFSVQLKTHAQVYKSKKGKGSYTRKTKHKKEFE